ncbi:MAG: ATP-dependent Clp protease ATP-binding subunit [Clostridia bacterium]|nr:ATP-dependent Clp protease ATP-binding subunit [Clostridia bacterium]
MNLLCAKCKKNLAVVFISKMEGGKRIDEGYCLKCGRELNLISEDMLTNLGGQMGLSKEDFEAAAEEMEGLFDGDMDMSQLGAAFAGIMPDEDMEGEEGDEGKNPFSFFANLAGKKDKEVENSKGKTKKDKKEKNERKFLEMYGTNLTQKAKDGLIDNVIGRDLEMNRVIQILNRRTKNNPCLIGEPGVGKTAIAEGLAVKIAKGEVPEKLLDYEIYLIDMTAMVAGTQFRGQFESRLRNLIKEVKTLGNIVLVIDEVHSIVKAGDADGAMSAGNILKPALSKGEIQVIGATTLEEYRKYIEKDSALERRFQVVLVEEPTVEETVEILRGIKGYYEDYHKVKITDDIIRTAAVLSERYITERFLPDKAIDVIDEAASRANLENKALVKLSKAEKNLASLLEEKANLDGKEALEEADYAKLAEIKSATLKAEEEIAKIKAEMKDVYITTENLAEVIEAWTKIPVKNITEYESNRLINLEERLHERIVGQNEAVENVARAIRRKRVGISLKRRPVSFIFVGPTGVGKTELVKQIAREVFDSEEALIRLDMSEFMEKHSVAKLIGSPPGYVGYDDAGQLTEKIRRHPYSVILLDEIEKAHPDIFNMLLQILDDGRITDSHGKTVSFENTIIIMTSNAGSDLKSNIAGFSGEEGKNAQLKVDKALKEMFRPEFLNRVDEIVIFNELSKEELSGIITLMTNELRSGLLEKGISLEITDSAKELILKEAYNPKYGARPMRRYIERHIEDLIAQALIEGSIEAGNTAVIEEKNGKINLTIKK